MTNPQINGTYKFNIRKLANGNNEGVLNPAYVKAESDRELQERRRIALWLKNRSK